MITLKCCKCGATQEFACDYPTNISDLTNMVKGTEWGARVLMSGRDITARLYCQESCCDSDTSREDVNVTDPISIIKF